MEQLLFDYIGNYMPLTEQEKAALLELDIFRMFKKGHVLLREGEMSNAGYFVLKGCIRTYYMVEGEDKTTSFYTELEGFTPNCAMLQRPSEYYVSCVEDCIMLVSSIEMEAEIFEKFPRFQHLCRILSEQTLVEQQMNFDEFKISSPEQRYRLILKNRPNLLQRVPAYQMASYLGIAPESFSRLRKRVIDKEKNNSA